jgi:hypothetical protein
MGRATKGIELEGGRAIQQEGMYPVTKERGEAIHAQYMDHSVPPYMVKETLYVKERKGG